tara:strand:+ start:419 stop:1195 length:777 start_codon:yes stop_codon:yes gene_type:complete
LKNKVVLIIPCHLKSKRFPNKILIDIYGIPMVEHVRRRALLSKKIDSIHVSTCDKLISKNLEKFGVNTIRTSNKHKNATTRVAESINNIDCTHVILLNGDEPLLLPKYLDKLYENIIKQPLVKAWNLTAPITKFQEFTDESIVKCKLDKNNIISLYRSINLKNTLSKNKHRKVLGILAFRKDFLKVLVNLKETTNEIKYSIEQFRVIDYKFKLRSINVSKTLPSINEKKDLKVVKDELLKNSSQKKLLKIILNSKINE